MTVNKITATPKKGGKKPAEKQAPKLAAPTQSRAAPARTAQNPAVRKKKAKSLVVKRKPSVSLTTHKVPKAVINAVHARLRPLFAKRQFAVPVKATLIQAVHPAIGWSTLNRLTARRFQLKYLASLIPGSKRALKELRTILGDANVISMFAQPHPKTGVPVLSLLAVQPEESSSGAYTASLDAGFPMITGANELATTSIAHPMERSEHPHKISHRRAIDDLENELLEEELAANILGAGVLASMLDPCAAPNIGFPDEENRGLSMKLRVRTILVGGPESDFVISRNPARHISQDAAVSKSYMGPTFKSRSSTGVNNEWYIVTDPEIPASPIAATPSYLQVGGDTFFLVEEGMAESDAIGYFDKANADPRLPLVTRDVPGAYVKCIECAPGDTVAIQAETTNTTAGNYEVYVVFYDEALGDINTVTSTPLTGSGSVISATVVAPANASGVVSWGVRNIGGVASTFPWPEMTSIITLATSPVWVPIGNASGDDITLLLDHADDVRCVGCRATATYIGEKLEGGYVVAGQPPMPGDAEMPDPTLADLATTLGLKPMALNGSNPGASVPIFPLTKEEMDYHPIQSLYDDNDFGEALIKYKGTTSTAEAVILQTEMSLQARTERQTLMVTPGEVSLKAVASVFSFIAECNKLDFVTGNDNHEDITRSAERSYAEEHPTFSFLNGNTISVSLW